MDFLTLQNWPFLQSHSSEIAKNIIANFRMFFLTLVVKTTNLKTQTRMDTWV